MPTDAPLADPGAARVALALPAVRLAGLRKSFGQLAAVAGVDLEIAEGEFFTMLGPSGSGKTTLLRLIAGFERPDAGAVELGGVDVTRAAALRAQRQHRLPGLRAVPAHERAARTSSTGCGCGGCRGPSGGAAPRPRWRWSA